MAAAVSGRVPPPGPRPSPLTPQFMVYFTLGLALWAEDSYEDVLDNLTAGVPGLAGASVDKSSLHNAREKLGQAAMAEVFGRVAADPVAGADTVGARWRGRLVLAVDGFVVDVPEGEENRAVFGAPTGAQPRSGYPQAKVVTLAECGTHGLRAAAIGGYLSPERELAEEVIGAAGPGDVVLFDAGFPSVRLFQLAAEHQVAVVMRAEARIARNPVQVLGDGSYLARLDTAKKSGAKRIGSVMVRVIEYHLGGKKVRLLTSLLDPQEAPAAEIAQLYVERWQTEHVFREIKTIQQGNGYILRSHSPELVHAEIWAHLTVHVCLTRLTTMIADERGQDPDLISFIKVLKHARRTVIAQLARTVKAATRIATAMAADLRRYRNPARGPRTSARTIKRLRHRYPRRPLAQIGKPVTTRAAPTTIALIPATT
ncbi:MAG: IS4 family transposase [Catenulispora sp.]|nr:IS4 family transposase [Catenulispora sp.]